MRFRVPTPRRLNMKPRPSIRRAILWKPPHVPFYVPLLPILLFALLTELRRCAWLEFITVPLPCAVIAFESYRQTLLPRDARVTSNWNKHTIVTGGSRGHCCGRCAGQLRGWVRSVGLGHATVAFWSICISSVLACSWRVLPRWSSRSFSRLTASAHVVGRGDIRHAVMKRHGVDVEHMCAFGGRRHDVCLPRQRRRPGGLSP